MSLGASGGEGERSRLDQARQHTEEAAKAYRRAVRLAAARGASRGVRASKAEFFRRREALAAELERVGALAFPTPEAAAPVAAAFRAARITLEQVDLLARGRRERR